MIITFASETHATQQVKHAMEILFGRGIKKFYSSNGRYILVIETELEEFSVEEKISLFNYSDVVAYDPRIDDDYTPEYF